MLSLIATAACILSLSIDLTHPAASVTQSRQPPPTEARETIAWAATDLHSYQSLFRSAGHKSLDATLRTMSANGRAVVFNVLIEGDELSQEVAEWMKLALHHQDDIDDDSVRKLTFVNLTIPNDLNTDVLQRLHDDISPDARIKYFNDHDNNTNYPITRIYVSGWHLGEWHPRAVLDGARDHDPDGVWEESDLNQRVLADFLPQFIACCTIESATGIYRFEPDDGIEDGEMETRLIHMRETVAEAVSQLPHEEPRYALGVEAWVRTTIFIDHEVIRLLAINEEIREYNAELRTSLPSEQATPRTP